MFTQQFAAEQQVIYLPGGGTAKGAQTGLEAPARPFERPLARGRQPLAQRAQQRRSKRRANSPGPHNLSSLAPKFQLGLARARARQPAIWLSNWPLMLE